MLSLDDIDHIARLARLELTKEEREEYARQLSSILDYVSQLGKTDTTHVTYHYQVAGLENVTDEDDVVGCSDHERAALLSAFPVRSSDFLKVRGVFGA